MSENFDPTLEIGISGEGLSEADAKSAVENIKAADIKLGREVTEPVTEENVVQQQKGEEIQQNLGDKIKANIGQDPVTQTIKKVVTNPTAQLYWKDSWIGAGAGARDIASNIITTPERVIDFFSGEMGEEGKTEEGYKTEWDQFMYGDGEPIETKTWWGGLVRGITDVGGTIAVTGGVGKGVKALTWGTKGVQAVKKATTLGGVLKEGALIGLRYDLVAKNEEQDNFLGALTKHYGWIDTPFATNDTDHPAITKLKHVVEGMALGGVIDATIFKMTPLAKQLAEQGGDVASKAGSRVGDVYNAREELAQLGKEDLQALTDAAKKAGKDVSEFTEELLAAKPEDLTELGKRIRKVTDYDYDSLRSDFAEFRESRLNSIELQKREQAKSQMKDPGFRAPKNEPIADKWQGTSTSNSSAADVDRATKRTKTEWGAEDGHVGSLTSNTQIERMAKGSGETEEVMKEILGNFRSQGYIKQLQETARRQGKTLAESVGADIDMFRAVYEGRNTSDVSNEEFFKLFTRDQTPLYQIKTNKLGKEYKAKVGEYVKPEYIKALDMVNTSLFNDIRDSGITGRELADIVNLKSVDGPAQQLVDKLIAGLELRKYSSAEVSQQLADFGDARLTNKTRLSRKELKEKIKGDVQQSIDAYRAVLDLTTEDGGDEVFKAMLEGITMAKDIHTIEDLDKFMRYKMRGGSWAGDEKKTGVFLNEMGTMFSHSVLSGPKTPIRAIMGTSSATFSRPLAMAMGGAMKGDWVTARAGLASLNALRESVGESFSFFKSRLNSYWAGDLASIKTRYIDRTKLDNEWLAFGHWAESRGNTMDKLLYRTANMVRGMNDSSLLTYSTKIMAATDDAFTLMIGRAKAREKAFLAAAEQLPDSNFANFDAKFFKDMEDKFNKEIWNPDGTLSDAAAEYSKKEATLTSDLQGFTKGLQKTFNSSPWAKPFFLFAKTGINGLTLTAKHTPGFNFLVDEFNQIAKAKPGDDLTHLTKYGIKSNRDLINAKAVQNGRLALGSGALFMASMAYLSGGLHGNGPTDRVKRQAWLDAGWKPRTIKIGDVWVNYDAFEPYNQILALVADIGDHQDLMGEEWTENRLGSLALALANTATSKSYLAGLQSFVDLFSGAPGQQNRIIASLMNNTVPLSGLRNEIGKVLTPHTRELGSDIQSSIRNRNLITENIALDPLPIKYDILTGNPIKDHNFVTRMFNAVSPVNFNLDYSPGRQLLFDSGYDLRTSTYSAPDGTDLSDSPKVRSMYQRAIGEQNLLAQFDKMAADEEIQVSMAEMNWHKRNGMKDVDPKSFPHYKRIAKAFDKAKKRAWAQIKKENDVQKLLLEERNQKLKNYNANQGTIDKILNIPK